jgi:hypothetical protein
VEIALLNFECCLNWQPARCPHLRGHRRDRGCRDTAEPATGLAYRLCTHASANRSYTVGQIQVVVAGAA